MAWIEQQDKRNRKEKHYYDTDSNTLRAVLTIHDQHYKDESDNWQDVNESFEDDTGGFDKKCDKTRHIVRIANGGARRWYPRRNVLTEYVDILNIEYWDGNSWNNLNLPTPVWTNNKSEWDMSYMYASLTNTWRRLKADFILKNSNAPTGLRYEIVFVGLTYNPTTGELTSTTDGLVWGTVERPIAYDANKVIVPVAQSYDGTYLEWLIDTTGAIFPIDVDPTFKDGYGGDVESYIDTMMYQGTPTTTFDSQTWLELGNDGGSSQNLKVLLRFDVSSLSGATINSGTLTLIGLNADSPADSVFSNILSANSSWTEAGACWSYRVGTTNWAGSAGCSTSGTDYSATQLATQLLVNGTNNISLSASQMQTWIDSGNYGILVHSSNQASWNIIHIYSSDHATTSYRPYLEIDYTSDSVGLSISNAP